MCGKSFRILIAYVQVVLLIGIIGSGTLFMHKHTTSSGQIIVHTHPYNLKTDPDGTKHKHTDNEIHFLDVVFNGSYLQTDGLVFDAATWGKPLVLQSIALVPGVTQDCDQHFYLRGPPQFV